MNINEAAAVKAVQDGLEGRNVPIVHEEIRVVLAMALERDALRAQLAAVARERDEARAKAEKDGNYAQNAVDKICHYRNLAIILGAKPEQMLGKFDRDLCVAGIDKDDNNGGYHMSVQDVLDDNADTWGAHDKMERERDEARADAARLRAMLDAKVERAIEQAYKLGFDAGIEHQRKASPPPKARELKKQLEAVTSERDRLAKLVAPPCQLERELAELEATDPTVAAAKAKLDQVAAELVSPPLTLHMAKAAKQVTVDEAVVAKAAPPPKARELAKQLDAARDSGAEAFDAALQAFGQLQEQLVALTAEREHLSGRVTEVVTAWHASMADAARLREALEALVEAAEFVATQVGDIFGSEIPDARAALASAPNAEPTPRDMRVVLEGLLPDPTRAKPNVVERHLAMGRMWLRVAGAYVAVEGSQCFDRDFGEDAHGVRRWTGEDFKRIEERFAAPIRAVVAKAVKT